MSDEYQPSEVVESQPELEGMALEPMPAPDMAASDPTALESAPELVSAEPELTTSMAVTAETSGEVESVEILDAEDASPALVEPMAAVVVDDPAAETSSEGDSESMAAEESGAASPSIVSIAELEASKPTFAEKINVVLAQVGTVLQGRGWLVGAAIAVLLIIFLFVPPISLAQRLSAGGGYELLNAENPTVEHSDGLRVTADSEADNKVRVKLSTIPRADFTAETLPKDMAPALEALPTHLMPKSPYYMLAFKGKDRGPATVNVDIPNESEPWETLDLYTWDAEAATWQWIPSQLDSENARLMAEVDSLPASLMVMQTGAVPQSIATEASTLELAGADIVLTEVNVPGMLIGTIGGLTGDMTQLPVASETGTVAVVPLVRNWVPNREPNWGLVSDMLNAESDRETHIAELVKLASSDGYRGLVLDYRALLPRDREAYASFVTALASAFHENDLWLAVVVDTPQQTIEGLWDTGGYAWQAIGAAADQLRIVMPLDPQDYISEGPVEQMITWAATQVQRSKLVLVYSTLSTDGAETMSFDDILTPLGPLTAASVLTDSVEPGTAVSFTLGAEASVETDVNTGATRVAVGENVYWLGNSQWLRTRLDIINKYKLGGVVLRDLLSEGNVANVLPAVADYEAGIQSSSYVMPEISWEVTEPDGNKSQATTALTQPNFTWTAPVAVGDYSVAATVGGLDKGSVMVSVAEPTPVPTDTLATDDETEDGKSAATSSEDPEDPRESEPEETEPTVEDDTEEIKAAFVADVTVPDNTRFEKGEAFVKTWRLKNAGNTPWPEDTVLAYASGEQMTEVKEVEVGEVAEGETVDISVDLTAPDADGTFKGVWSLYAGDAEVPGGAVMVIIKAGEEQAVVPQPGPVVPVAPGGFELGGHVRDMGLPYKDKMHYAGMTWVKDQIRFGEDGAWKIQAAHAAGFKMNFGALGGAGMVTEAGFEQKYAAWVAQLAAAGADAIEIWNEPNIEREWQIGYISPQAYTKLLCASYAAIKAANPGTAVISAAPAPTGWFGGCGPNGCDDQPWIEGLYNAGAAGCMDYIGAHHNAGATSPSARIGHPANPGDPHHSWFFLPQTELYYNIFRGTRQLFYTEMGYASQEGLPGFSDQFAWARGIDNAEQAAWLAEAVQLGINTGMVRCITVWNIDFVRYGYDPQDGFAIIRPGGGCPACESLHNVLGTR